MKPKLNAFDSVPTPASIEAVDAQLDAEYSSMKTVNTLAMIGDVYKTFSPKLSSPTGEVLFGALVDGIILKSEHLDSERSSTPPALLNLILNNWKQCDGLINKLTIAVNSGIQLGLIEPDMIHELSASPKIGLNAIQSLKDDLQDLASPKTGDA